MRLVIKFGGIPVKDGKSIRSAAELAVGRFRKGNRVVVVTSAKAEVTDQLLKIAHRLVKPPTKSKERAGKDSRKL